MLKKVTEKETKFNDKFYLRNQDNFKYIVQFLRNGGEKMRAIRLVMDVLEMNPTRAEEYVGKLNKKIPMPEY